MGNFNRDNAGTSSDTSNAHPANHGADQSGRRSGAHVKGLVESVKDVASDGLSGAASVVSDIASGAATSASKFTGDVADTLRDGAEAQKNAGADAVSGLARSAREAAGRLDETSPQIAGLVRQSADTVERVSSSIRSQSIGELMDSTSAFAARQPVAFFGVGILAGLVLSRLLRDANAR